MYSKIISRIRTKDDAQKLENELDLLMEKIYSAHAEDFQKALEKNVRSWVSAELKEGLAKAVDKEKYLKDLAGELGKLATVNLTIAFDPSEESLDRIHGWLKDHVGSGLILEINVDPTILGGAKIIFGGRYLDFSLTAKFTKVFSEDMEWINQILSNE